MPDIRYLSLGDVIALHALVMARTGSPPAPLRSEAGLGSAVMRPQMAAHYEQADLIRQAALLVVGVSEAQAFLDGNKRTALAALDVFLRINGDVIRAAPLDLARQTEAIATRPDALDAATARLEAWLREHVEETGKD
jgi:death-on-curing protein